MKVNELAKKLKVKTAFITGEAERLGIRMEKPGGSLTPEEVKKIEGILGKKGAKKEKPAVKKEVKKKAKAPAARKAAKGKVKKEAKKVRTEPKEKKAKPRPKAKPKPEAGPEPRPELKPRPAPVAAPTPAPAPKAEPVKAPLPKEAAPAKPRIRPLEKPKELIVPAAKVISVTGAITVGSLAEKMGVKVNELIKKFLTRGQMFTINQSLNKEIVISVAREFGFHVEFVSLYTDESIRQEEDRSRLRPRPPVVTVMGHVDHGKTSLLDAIRESNVASKEFGAITQHIGAYRVSLPRGRITFLDTPGHEVFTGMRARGAQVTDIVILVVAADDGVMPQTVEAIDHAKAADVPIVVAINKIDLPNANTEKVKQELSKYNLIPEEWGGKTIFVEVSARQKLGTDELLENILLEAEMLELKADPAKRAEGVIIEAKLHKQRGPVATVLIQSGTLSLKDAFVAGLSAGKVRAMIDEHGKKLRTLEPSGVAEILGFSELPRAGDRFFVVQDEQTARRISRERQLLDRQEGLGKFKRITMKDLHAQIEKGELSSLRIILKSDVQGSVEALCDSLKKLATEEVSLEVIHSGSGGINENDVNLAAASNALILGLHVRPTATARSLAEREGVDIHTYQLIYEAIDQTKKAMEGLLKPEFKEVFSGRCRVKQIFKIPDVGTVAGCSVYDGKIPRDSNVRILRDNVIIYEGKISSLKRFKDDVKEVSAGFECGVGFEKFSNIKEDDEIESFVMERVERKL